MDAIIAFVAIGIVVGLVAFLRAADEEAPTSPTQARRASMGARLVW